MDLLYLNEDQNAAFDEEYHSADALAAKIDAIRSRFPSGPQFILDLGGGTGRFADAMLKAFPQTNVVVLDVSEYLLSLNKPDPRKTTVHGSVEDMTTILSGYRFDVIGVNWLLHHLVGWSHSNCKENCISALIKAQQILSQNGVIAITENIFDGPFGTNIPSHVIFGITRIRNPHFVKIARRYFNTSGVGVCFRSKRNWERVIHNSGLQADMIYRNPWPQQPGAKLVKMALLGQIGAPWHAHWFCTPSSS